MPNPCTSRVFATRPNLQRWPGGKGCPAYFGADGKLLMGHRHRWCSTDRGLGSVSKMAAFGPKIGGLFPTSLGVRVIIACVPFPPERTPSC